jgi:hypothetical protein
MTRNAGSSSNLGEVQMVLDPTVTSSSLDAALPQFSRGAPPVSLRSLRPAYSAAQALPDVERISGRPVVAMTEYRDWLWYATDVAATGDPHGPGAFLSGYAVQKGGYLAWRF